jgi:hypothetical protein
MRVDANAEIATGLEAGRSNIDDVTDNDIVKMKCGRLRAIADRKATGLARAVTWVDVVHRILEPLAWSLESNSIWRSRRSALTRGNQGFGPRDPQKLSAATEKSVQAAIDLSVNQSKPS